MNRFKCPACGRNQYTACDTAERCIYCGHKELKKMETLEPEEGMKLERLLIETAQSVMISAQTDFYIAYQTAVAGAMAIGCTEEKAIEIADKAVERNAEKIGIVSERKNIVETIRKKAVKEKPDFIDALLAEVEK